MPRVAIAAQVRLNCEGLAEVISRRSDHFRLVGTDPSATEWRQVLAREDIEVGFVDISMPDTLAAACGRVALIGLAVPEDESAILACAGLAGLVRCGAGLDDVTEALRAPYP